MFNVYKYQLSRQTGSRNLMVPKTLPTIWHTYVKLVTKYQISAFWSCNFFFINLPLKLFNFNFILFFFLKIILILNLEEKKLAGQEKKIYSDLTFSQYNISDFCHQ
jgi:hypothetical protein